MIDLILLVVVFCIAFYIEAGHDKVLADKEALIKFLLKEDGLLEEIKKEQAEKRKWHRLDWWYLVSVAALVSYLYAGVTLKIIPVLVIISMLKILVFNIRLNILLNLGGFYLSKEGFEGFFKGKEKLFYFIAFLLLLISVLYLVYENIQ